MEQYYIFRGYSLLHLLLVDMVKLVGLLVGWLFIYLFNFIIFEVLLGGQ